MGNTAAEALAAEDKKITIDVKVRDKVLTLRRWTKFKTGTKLKMSANKKEDADVQLASLIDDQIPVGTWQRDLVDDLEDEEFELFLEDWSEGALKQGGVDAGE